MKVHYGLCNLSHEFNHVVQYTYNSINETWFYFMEEKAVTIIKKERSLNFTNNYIVAIWKVKPKQ